MVAKKRKTKRLTLKLKYKVQKKVRDHHKKLKKEKRKHPEKFRKRTKDPGVPKTLPFYDQVIKEAEEAKAAQERRREEDKLKRRELRAQAIAKKRDIGNINELIRTAEERGVKFEADQAVTANTHGNLSDRSAKAYYKEFKKVVEAADVVLEVLDARDPLGTRVPQMESTVTGQSGKKLVLLLNKADLVPRENLEKWLQYLRREYPTIAFKSSTQLQGSRLAQSSAKIMKSSEELVQSSKCLGADVLMQLLKNYCRNKDIKTAISVGVVGLPNVGKSSVINSLKRSKSCGVGSTPGFTKTMQPVQLDSKIQLLDCPGIILPGGDTSDASAALRNAVKIEQLDDPIKPVEAILARANKNQLMIYYQIPDFQTVDQFLALLAKRLGKLKKKGIPDRAMAARKVLQDWNTGHIKFYTQPPEVPDTKVGTTLITELSKEFDIDSLLSEEGSMLKALPTYRPSQTMVVDSLGPVMEVNDQEELEEESEEEEEKMEEEEEGIVEGGLTLPKDVCINMDDGSGSSKPADSTEKKKRWETPLQEFDPQTMSMKKFQKKMQKKTRKESQRNVKRTDDLTSAFQKFSGLKDNNDDDDYDFAAYFDK
ncbi:guanine nucleotide-binding protein-like 3 homolog [Homarus americanus]|uniref:Guanine nucleotide-binding protein-like 3 homolog n=1 Tax=Homarus americanus TaxID=6706 RepID=A0A8J5N1G2_HOMAM|nr:guanine nucleotide-binding protein-like 3 homolog [Homarus americanus]KAG7171454.1 Guanine nucleotide-binding protein-like 3-like [Homarus americanus]